MQRRARLGSPHRSAPPTPWLSPPAFGAAVLLICLLRQSPVAGQTLQTSEPLQLSRWSQLPAGFPRRDLFRCLPGSSTRLLAVPPPATSAHQQVAPYLVPRRAVQRVCNLRGPFVRRLLRRRHRHLRPKPWRVAVLERTAPLSAPPPHPLHPPQLTLLAVPPLDPSGAEAWARHKWQRPQTLLLCALLLASLLR